MLHIIFQRHHLAPDDFFAKSPGTQAFILESMKIQLNVEKEARERRHGAAGGGDDEWQQQ